MINKKSAAFTLIELMVVLLIISLVITAAALYSVNTATIQAKQTAKTLYALLGLAQEKAVLQPAVYSFRMNGNGFYFQQYQLASNSFQGKWLATNNDPYLHFYNLPAKVSVQLILLNTSMQNRLMQQTTNAVASNSSMIIFYNNGDYSPFVINIGVVQKPPMYKIIGNENGVISLVELH